jgi:hypothetical protein
MAQAKPGLRGKELSNVMNTDQDASAQMLDDLYREDARPPKIRITLSEFWGVYRTRLNWLVKVLAIALPLTFVAVPVCMHLFFPLTYTAEMTVAPNRMVDPGGEGSSGGLSSLIGLNGPMDAQFELYLSTRKSNLLAQRMMATPGVPQKIFKAFWDPETQQWRPPAGLIQDMKRGLNSAMGFASWTQPTPGDLQGFLDKAFTVEGNKRTLITKISFSDPDPAFAKWLMTTVHDQAEAILKDEAQQRTRIMIAHAVHELSVVTVAEQRSALIQLLSQQEKQLLMIDKNLPYAAVVVDPPSADLPDNAPRPLRNIFVALVVVSLLCAGLLAALVLREMRGIKRRLLEENGGDYSAALAHPMHPQDA